MKKRSQSTGVSTPQPIEPTKLRQSREVVREKILERVDKGRELLCRPIQSRNELETLEADAKKWSDYTRQLLASLFTTVEPQREFGSYHRALYGLYMKFHEELEHTRSPIQTCVTRLESLLERVDLFEQSVDVNPDSAAAQECHAKSGTKIFVVHGHDAATKESVARLLLELDLDPVILHEVTNRGRTIIEKLEAEAREVKYAVVILSPDDEGRTKNSQELRDRARQNVILELGLFIGLLGRNRVCALHKGNLELPSDIDGVVYIELDAHDAWQTKLAKELRAAEYVVDLNRL